MPSSDIVVVGIPLSRFNYQPVQYFRLNYLASRLIDHSQKMTVAARAMAEKKTVGHRS